MGFKSGRKFNLLMITLVLAAMLAACASSTGTQGNAGVEKSADDSGTPAMVDRVNVEVRDNHYYAVIEGFYPDPCTYISSVEQIVEGSTINITLLTEKTAGVMCAAMLTQYSVDILLTIGGLIPQEYTVVINDGPATTFILE
jgi:hypothetical protein